MTVLFFFGLFTAISGLFAPEMWQAAVISITGATIVILSAREALLLK